MPKIIKDLESRLVEEAQRQIAESGYSAMTIRSIAKACNIAVGTVYNYFPSKEDLIAAHLLQDWRTCNDAIAAVAAEATAPLPVLVCMHRQLTDFSARYASLFRDKAAVAGFAVSFRQYHRILRNQLAQHLLRFCDSDFTAEFAAESLLAWTFEGKSFQEFCPLLEKLF